MSKYYQDTSNENREKEIEKMLEDETGCNLANQVTITKLKTGYLVNDAHAFSDLGDVFNFVDDCFEGETIKATLPDNDGWIEWNGGECPVDIETKVHLRFKDGEETLYDNWNAGAWNWHHVCGGNDIIAYRVVSE